MQKKLNKSEIYYDSSSKNMKQLHSKNKPVIINKA
jgi:hypothetical protein